jgi:hypothetical protein
MWEWGSGGSTKWFGERVAKLWSMEHTVEWNKRTARFVTGMDNVFLMRKDLDGDYIKEIHRFPNEFFDCVLIDGRNRVACVRAAVSKAKKVIVLDNGLRERYKLARKLMDDIGWDMYVARWGGENTKESWHSLVWVKPGVEL